MITGKLKDLNRYIGINKNLDIAIAYIQKEEWRNAPMGETPVAGQHVLLRRFDCKTVSSEEKPFEGHQVYGDIQLLVKGNEIVEYTDLLHTKALNEYQKENDFQEYQGTALGSFLLEEDSFAICFPEDLHKPDITHVSTKVEKAVIKFMIEEGETYGLSGN